MEPFRQLNSVAAPLLRANIDTDIIIPMDRYLTAEREQMHSYAFETLRYLPDGAENPEFILNTPAFRDAQILITGANFGCGSSRESAVWALYGLGIRCIIAPSFGNIFYNNCFQNGLLAITLDEQIVLGIAGLVGAEQARALKIDLDLQTITPPDGDDVPFEIDHRRRIQLLQGLDDIGGTLTQVADIKAHREMDEAKRPWVYLSSEVRMG